jgi:hypothetical protein
MGSAGESVPLAPSATEMQFCPLSSTMMRAVPLAQVLSTTRRASIPSFFILVAVSRPNTSSPTLAMNMQFFLFAESLATATAWLAPLPPGFINA